MPIEVGTESVEQMGVRIMAGDAPILMDGGIIDFRTPMARYLFDDWLPIMHSDPRFNENEWFAGLLDVAMIDGWFIGPAIVFGFEYIVANSNVPGLAEAFSEYETMNIARMIDLYYRFADENMYISQDFDITSAVRHYMSYFLNLETGEVNFNSPEFINLITDANRLTHPGRVFGDQQSWRRRWGEGEIPTREWEHLQAQSYLFRRVHFAPEYFSIFDEETIFVNPLPFVDANENLIVNFLPFILNSGATAIERAMAWDFIAFAARTDFDENANPQYRNPVFGTLNGNIDLTRHMVAMHHSSEIHHSYTGWRVSQPWLLVEDLSKTMDIWSDIIITTSKMPMADARFASDIIEDIIWDVLEQYHNGLITAEAAASTLQNTITLVLMEMQ